MEYSVSSLKMRSAQSSVRDEVRWIEGHIRDHHFTWKGAALTHNHPSIYFTSPKKTLRRVIQEIRFPLLDNFSHDRGDAPEVFLGAQGHLYGVAEYGTSGVR